MKKAPKQKAGKKRCAMLHGLELTASILKNPLLSLCGRGLVDLDACGASVEAIWFGQPCRQPHVSAAEGSTFAIDTNLFHDRPWLQCCSIYQ